MAHIDTNVFLGVGREQISLGEVNGSELIRTVCELGKTREKSIVYSSKCLFLISVK